MTNPPKWWEVHRNDEEKCVFVGKDGKSGLIRGKDKDGKPFSWRTTDSLSKESGLSKKRTEEILDHWCKKGVVRVNPKDPEKWGYWENVGSEKAEPNPVETDHKERMDKVKNLNAPAKKGIDYKKFLRDKMAKTAPTKKPPDSGTQPNPAPATPAPANPVVVTPVRKKVIAKKVGC